jgi:hypothetical protein
MDPEPADYADQDLPPDRMPSLQIFILVGAGVIVFSAWAFALWDR